MDELTAKKVCNIGSSDELNISTLFTAVRIVQLIKEGNLVSDTLQRKKRQQNAASFLTRSIQFHKLFNLVFISAKLYKITTRRQ